MKRIITSAIAVLLVCGVALANEKAGEKGSCPAGKKSAKCTVKGIVETVDAAAMKLTVKDKKGEVKEVVLNAETKITGKGVKAIADIAVGDKVEAKIVDDVAKKVNVKKAKAPKAPKAAKEAKPEEKK